MFKNMKIGQRMAMGFGLLLVVMLVLIWQGVQGMAGIQANLQRIVSVNNVRTDLCHEVNSDLRELFINVRNIIISKDVEKQREYQARIVKFREDYVAKLKKVEEMTSKDDKVAHELMSQIRESLAAAAPLNNRVIELAMSKNDVEAGALLSKEAAPAGRKISEATEKLIVHNGERSKMRFEEARDQATHS